MGTGVRIFWTIVILAACVGGYFLFDHYRQQTQAEDGAVNCVGCMTTDEKARFDKENSGDTADGLSEHKTRTARAEDAAGNPQGAVAAGQTPIAPATASQPAAAPTPATARTPETSAAAFAGPGSVATGSIASVPAAGAPRPASAPGNFALTNNASPASLPVSDSVSPNPTNNMRFAGTGAYQWYRQGNLTWRVDTASGGSCIAFATLEEWRKQIVISHGCGRGA